MKILSWNVNGMRSVGKKGFFDWLEKESPDILCLQETKCTPEVLEPSYLSPWGYQSYWHSAYKPGYSGVAIYTKKIPQEIHEGIGVESIDNEGRVLEAEFKDFTVINAYFPNSQREHSRLGYKLEFCKVILNHCKKLKKNKRNFILCGDYNIAHKEIDLKNPKSNQNNAGFLPEERDWMTQFLDHGFVDTFREFCQDPDHYTWWSYRPGIRERNIGWRIDYHCVNEEFMSSIKNSFIMPEVGGSDHCPVAIVLK